MIKPFLSRPVIHDITTVILYHFDYYKFMIHCLYISSSPASSGRNTLFYAFSSFVGVLRRCFVGFFGFFDFFWFPSTTFWGLSRGGNA
jgi:hypothetical protein